jgi:uncharacterized DUF497 family protein
MKKSINNKWLESIKKLQTALDNTTNCSYNLEWDECKSLSNLEKHNLDFNAAHEIFNDFCLEQNDNRKPYGETRYILIGMYHGREAVMVYTQRGHKKRIISLRKANEREQKIYQQERLKALGCND